MQEMLKALGVPAIAVAVIGGLIFAWGPLSELFDLKSTIEDNKKAASGFSSVRSQVKDNTKELAARKDFVSKIPGMLAAVAALKNEDVKTTERFTDKRERFETMEAAYQKLLTRMTVVEALASSNKQALANNSKDIAVNDEFRVEQQPRGARRTERLDAHEKRMTRVENFAIAHRDWHLDTSETDKRNLRSLKRNREIRAPSPWKTFTKSGS